MGQEAEDQHRPDADMHHDVGCVEYVVPIRDVLNIDEVDDASVDESVQDVAGASANDECEADVFIVLNGLAKPQVSHNCTQQADAYQAKNPTHPLGKPKHTAVVANVGEVDQAIQFDRGILRNSVVNPIANQLRS